MITGHFLPEIGAPDPDAIAYLRRAWPAIPEDTRFRRYGEQEPITLRQLIRDEADAIKLQERFRNAIVEAAELATGLPRPRPIERRHAESHS